MARVTSKLQITIPKALADKLDIREGDEIEWAATADALRLRRARPDITIDERLRLFDAATRRQRRRKKIKTPHTRGWTREDLYHRGSR